MDKTVNNILKYHKNVMKYLMHLDKFVIIFKSIINYVY